MIYHHHLNLFMPLGHSILSQLFSLLCVRTKRGEILNQMRTFSGGRNTVPQIFFNAEHLGGNDDVQKLEQDGVLTKKVEVVKTTPVTMMMDHWYHPWY